MRYRDFCCIAIVVLLVIVAVGKASQTAKSFAFASVEINREDANRESSTILSADRWVEYQIQSDANSIRLLTNVALDSRDAPDHDLHNPRTGWRYAVDYELLDAHREMIQQATYHFRSQVHQLIDVESGEAIYPIFFGKSSLVATQTRAMQLPINRDDRRAAVLRVRVAEFDDCIHEVVARVLVRSEREDYDRRTTWNRMSNKRREGLSRFCVYDHDLLTIGERNNLLRWQWKSAPVINDFKKRYLFFIGDIDDQQVRGDQVPAGLYIDSHWRGTVPVPPASKRVRLEFRWVDPIRGTTASDTTASDAMPGFATIQWTGMQVTDRQHWEHRSDEPISETQVTTDGGLLQISSDRPVVVRAYVDSNDLPEQDSADAEIEITPELSFVRSFLSDSRAIQYDITHLDNLPTPMKLVLRYPYAPLFSNRGEAIGDASQPDAPVDHVHATWQFLRDDGSVAKQGVLEMTPAPSQYDRFTVAGQREPISDPSEFFCEVPSDVSQLRIHSDNCRLLVSAYVRPADLRSVTTVPEDYHAYNRATSTRRSWYGINPIDQEAMVQDNRSFIVQTQTRPTEPNEEVLAGRFEWERFIPDGKWIARQLLVPRDNEFSVRQTSIGANYYEITPAAHYQFADHDSQLFADATDVRLVYVSADHPGKIQVLIDGMVVYNQSARSARGEIPIDHVDLPSSGSIEVRSQYEARFFLAGKHVAAAESFLKRNAQRLKDGQLEFQYAKTSHDEELLTLELFRSSDDSSRCRVDVDIDGGPDRSSGETIMKSWTIRRRQYDLLAQPGHDSVLLGHSDQVDAGYRCFIRLGSDLPPGTYQIQVRRSDGGQDGYALLYRIVAQQRPVRMLHVDSMAGENDGN